MSLAKDSFSNWNTFLGHLEQRVAIRSLMRHPFFPAVLWTSVPVPPMSWSALTIERAFTGDRNVLLFEGIDERRVVEKLDTFPSRKDDRQKVFRVLTELDRCAL